MNAKKPIFEYDNYRQFLRDFYDHAKAENKKFSLGYFSKMAGFRSRSVLRQVMAGERNIALHSIEKFTRALKLSAQEAKFFGNLVRLNQASTYEEKQLYAQEILKSKNYKKLYPLKESQFNYFNCWYFVVVRELSLLPGFQEDPEWIAKRVHPQITPAEAKRALTELTNLGFLKRNEDGRLVHTDGWFTTADEVTSAAIVHYHQELLKRASEAIKTVNRDKRDVSAQTFAVSQKIALKVKEMIQDFRKEIETIVSQDQERDSVYQLNFQLFPVVDLKEETEDK